MVYFFTAAHTPGCNLEAHLFSEAMDKFTAQHATVIGVTAGNADQLADSSKETEHCGGKFPVAADSGATIAKQYDSLLTGKPGWSNRTSYVISPTGAIVHVSSLSLIRVRSSPSSAHSQSMAANEAAGDYALALSS